MLTLPFVTVKTLMLPRKDNRAAVELEGARPRSKSDYSHQKRLIYQAF